MNFIAGVHNSIMAECGGKQHLFYCFILFIFLSLLVFAGCMLLAIFLAGNNPRNIEASVVDATLTRFALATGPATSLSYNLTAVVLLHNPNKRHGVRYDSLQADFLFEGERFEWAALPAFDQHPKNTTVVRTTIGGTSYVTLGSTGLGNFARENRTGVFDLEVRLDALVGFTACRSEQCRFTARCPVTVQLAADGAANGTFRWVECEVQWPQYLSF